jgi:two-component system chemotaxis response regulator CheB
MNRKTKVLIVDDSAVVRRCLQEILESDPDIEVIATAKDPYVAAKKMREEAPDVVTLDVQMPRMDGISFLRKIMRQHPLPVVMCSALTEEGSEIALKALECGAVDIITKPKMESGKWFQETKISICDAVKGAARARLNLVTSRHDLKAAKRVANTTSERPPVKTAGQLHGRIVVIGASTGGAEAIRVLVESLPEDAPGMAIVQHMPERFTAAFARRLDTLSRISVKEARNGDELNSGRVLIAPGNRHMMLKCTDSRYFVEVKDGPLVSRHRPSVDVLFRSTARYAGENAIGVIMTGMGDDGARGMLEMRRAGALTIAQDESSCAVFGMPKEAVKLGAAARVLPLEAIADSVLGEASSPACA